jgi:ribosomal-protein-alanine N-acetyltransferase
VPAELRHARPDDAARLAAIDARVSAHPWSRGQFATACSGEESAATTLVLEDGGRVEGFIIYSQVLDEASILNIAVLLARQRHGVGGEILSSALQRMRESGMTRCMLEVRESNTAAQRLYRGHRFALDGTRKKYYPTRDGREDALLMSIEL